MLHIIRAQLPTERGADGSVWESRRNVRSMQVLVLGNFAHSPVQTRTRHVIRRSLEKSIILYWPLNPKVLK